LFFHLKKGISTFKCETKPTSTWQQITALASESFIQYEFIQFIQHKSSVAQRYTMALLWICLELFPLVKKKKKAKAKLDNLRILKYKSPDFTL